MQEGSEVSMQAADEKAKAGALKNACVQETSREVPSKDTRTDLPKRKIRGVWYHETPGNISRRERIQQCNVTVKHMIFSDTGPLDLASRKRYQPISEQFQWDVSNSQLQEWKSEWSSGSWRSLFRSWSLNSDRPLSFSEEEERWREVAGEGCSVQGGTVKVEEGIRMLTGCVQQTGRGPSVS